MTQAARAAAVVLDRYPDLPGDAALVFLLFCADAALSVPAAAKKLGLAQSDTARHIALLQQAGLMAAADGHARAPRYRLTPSGRDLCAAVAADLAG